MKVKRILSAFLAVTMLLASMSFSVYAESNGVAMVGGVSYATMSEALQNAGSGEITVVGDPGSFTISEPVVIKGDDNGGSKYGLTDYQYITINEGINGKVVIENIAFNGTTNHIIVFNGSDFSNLELEIKDCYIEYNGNRGIYVDKELKSLTVSGCTIDNVSSSYVSSYAIWTNPTAAGTMNILDNTIVGAGALRGAIHVGDNATNGAEITISGNTISGVERGVQVANASDNVDITVSNNTFSNIKLCEGSTKTEAECAAIFIHKNASTKVDVNVVANTATDSKAIIYSENPADTEDFIGEYTDNSLNDAYVNIAGEAYVAQIDNEYYTSFEAAVAAIRQDGSDTIIKLLDDIDTAGNISFKYGTGKVVFTADHPVTVKQTKLATDWDIVESIETQFVIDENVTFEIYDNASGIYVYYGPSFEIKGTVTGGQNWGAFYLFQGNHKITETGKIGVGRVQLGFNNTEVKGEVDTNYLLVEGSTFIADGAIIDANVIYDNNNGGQRWGKSDFIIKNGSEVNTSKLTLSYADSSLAIDTTSSLTASKIEGKGTIEIDVSKYDGYSDLSNIINADLSGFTGEVEVVGGESATAEIVNGQLIIKATPAGGPIFGYTAEDKIWGETQANSKESYIVKVYSDDTFMGQSELKNIDGIIDGNLCPTWNVMLDPANSSDEYWTTTWTIAPSMDCLPTHVALVVDGVEVSRTAIQLNGPDNINKIYAAVTDADGKILSYATSLQNALNKVADGGRIELFCDVELSSSLTFSKDIAFTLDGNGYTVKPAKGSKEKNSAFNWGMGSDDTRATRRYNIENVVFDGWSTAHVVRLQGTTSVISNCTFKNNTQSGDLGLVTVTFADVTVDGCVFENNDCVKCIDVNSWGDGSTSNSVIKNCLFNNNTVSGPGVVLYSDGASLTVKDNKFVSNTVNTTGNAATLYMGFMGGINVTGNLFENNTVTTTLDRTTRVAGAIFAGFADENCEITENVFVNNTAVANGNVAASGVAYSAFYGAGNLDGNYWGGGEPVLGDDFTHEYPTSNDLTVEKYYDGYSVDADGNVILEELKAVVSKVVAIQYVERKDQADADEGLKVYDIVVVAKDEHIINRLNAVDLTFANSSDKVAYEIVPAEDITLTHNTDYPNRYMFNFEGKDNVDDTDVALTIGQVRLTGFDTFTFKVAEVETNLVTATTIDDNIVSYYIADGLVLNTDIDGNGDYLGFIKTEITVPKRDLTINVLYPNGINENVYAYQQMSITITGPDNYERVIYLGNGDSVKENGDCLSLADGGYSIKIEDELTLNSAYTVVLEGAGYRSVKYTVSMTEAKTLNFWNNVKDNEAYVEVSESGVGKYAQKVTFLAGDIVKDNNINVYDLSAVVSYFGEIDLAEDNKPEYAKYDLNRDGKIDSKDVAYVLVSWGN